MKYCHSYYIILMLTNILKEEYAKNRPQQLKKLYQNPVVTGCLFQSLSEFQQNIILRFVSNGGQLKQKELLKQLNQNDPSAINECKQTFQKLQQLCIIQYIKLQSNYKLYKIFTLSLEEFILNSKRASGVELPSNFIKKSQAFDLLHLLYEGNPILQECKLSKIDWKSNQSGNVITKQNFDYIRSSVPYKIGIIIKGYLRYNKNKNILSDILSLSLLDPNKAHKITQNNKKVVEQFESLKLLKRINQNQYVISDFLHNFSFSKQFTNTLSLKCRIIIQTNFKVYTIIQSQANFQIIKSILKTLIDVQHEQYDFQQLIVGSITRQKMDKIFEKDITSVQYFQFFEQYMQKNISIEKDLGKWNKIKFLGLEGINNESSIPNNVKQQVKLWESIRREKEQFQNNVDLRSDSNSGDQKQK